MTKTERSSATHAGWGAIAATITALGLLFVMLAFAKDAHAASWTVEANSNFGWSPPSLEIEPGDEVSWNLVDDEFHNVMIMKRPNIHVITSPTGSNAAPTFNYLFNDEGNYDYICTLHPGMDGSLKVGDPPPPEPEPKPPKLAVSVSPAKATAGAKAKQVKLTVTARNTGGRSTIAPVDSCVNVPANRFTVKGGVCKVGGKLDPAGQTVSEFILVIKKGARGKKTNVGISVSSAGLTTASATTAITVKKAKKKKAKKGKGKKKG